MRADIAEAQHIVTHLGSDSGDDSCRRGGTASGMGFGRGFAAAPAAGAAAEGAAGGAAAGGDVISPAFAPTSPSSSSPDSFSEGSRVGSLAGTGEGEGLLRLGLLLRGLHVMKSLEILQAYCLSNRNARGAEWLRFMGVLACCPRNATGEPEVLLLPLLHLLMPPHYPVRHVCRLVGSTAKA